MAAQNIAVSALTDVLLDLEDVLGDTGYRNGDMVRKDIRGHAPTASILMENNTSRTIPILEGEACIGVKVDYLRPSVDDAEILAPGATFSTLTCDVATGDGAQAERMTLANNIYASVPSITVSFDQCNNVFIDPNSRGASYLEGIRVFTVQIAAAMAKMREVLNERYAGFVVTLATPVNRDLNLPSRITFNALTDQFYCTTDINGDPFFQSARSFTDLQILAENNDMGNFFALSGRANYANLNQDAVFDQLNDNGRYLTRVGAFPFQFDTRTLDTLTGTNSTFLIENGSYITWNVPALHGTEPTLVSSSPNELYEMSVTDPNLLINENGTLRPVTYQVLMKKACLSTRTANGSVRFGFNMEMRYIGGLYKSPAAADTHTGVLWLTTNPA